MTPADRIAELEAKLARYESAERELPESFVARVSKLNYSAMGDQSEWDTHGNAVMDLARGADELRDYAVAMKVENEALRENAPLGSMHTRAVKAEADTVSALVNLADAVLLNSRVLAELDAAKDALVAERKISADLANQIYDARVTRDEAKSALATARQEERERIAKVIRCRGQSAVTMINADERLDEKKAYAWDCEQHAIAIEALTDEEAK